MLQYTRGAAIVYLNRIISNIKIIKQMAGSSLVMAVVKANGYGHGIVQAAFASLEGGADFLGVATAQEGVVLRNNGIKAPILILGAIFEADFESILKNKLTSTVFTLKMAQSLSNYAVSHQKIANIHIKIDTGMNRIGFVSQNKSTFAEIGEIFRLKNLNIEGAFSHFAASDSDVSFSNAQFEKFEYTVDKLKTFGLHIPITHISNSGAILNYPKYNLDMVRSGVLTYGLSPSSTIEGKNNIQKLGILPALEFRSQIINIKEVQKNETVGYSRNYVATKNTKVATIPLGYADGIHRILSNRGVVCVDGVFCPIIGNICMDQFMIDISETNAKINDEISIINSKLPAEAVANAAQTINYEILTSISSRVERLYL